MEKKKLKEICTTVSRCLLLNKLGDNNGPYPLFGAKGIMKYIDFYDYENDYLSVIKWGAGVGRITRHPGHSSILGTMQGLMPNSDIDIDWFYFCLKNMHLGKQASVTTVPNLYFKDYGENYIYVPTFEEQKKVAKRLNKLSDCIDDCLTELNLLDELIKSRFIEMFGNDYSSSKYPIEKLGKYMTALVDFNANGSYEKLDSNVKMYDEPNYAWMVRTTDLENQEHDDIKYIDKDAYELLSKSKIFGGELIMSKIGSAGKIYLMPEIQMPASLGRNAFLMRFDEHKVDTVYLFYMLSTDFGTEDIMSKTRGAVTKTITKDDTRNIRYIDAPIHMQKEFSRFIKQINETKTNIRKRLNCLNELLNKKMNEYFGDSE